MKVLSLVIVSLLLSPVAMEKKEDYTPPTQPIVQVSGAAGIFADN